MTQSQYMLIAQTLIRDIEASRYEVGDLLPSESELCRAFDVSRHTVREALRLLVQRGFLTRHRGIGSRVASIRPQLRYVQSTEAIADLPQYVEETRLTITEVTDVLADGELGELLGCPQGQRWLYARGRRYVPDGRDPIALTDIYVNGAYAGVRDLLGIRRAPVYALIESRFGERVSEVKQIISARIIQQDEAQELNVPGGSAGLVVTRHYYGYGGRLLEVAVNLHPADRFSYSMSLRPNAG